MESRDAAIDYVRLLRRVVAHRWRIIVAAFALVALPTIVWTFLMVKNTYEASATLLKNRKNRSTRESLRTDRTRSLAPTRETLLPSRRCRILTSTKVPMPMEST